MRSNPLYEWGPRTPDTSLYELPTPGSTNSEDGRFWGVYKARLPF